MAARFFDIDGTLVEYHTNNWLLGARKMLITQYNNGNQIFLVTMRCHKRDADKEWSPERTRQTILKDLDEDGVKYVVMFDVQSPRIIVDDSETQSIKRSTNEPWS